MPKIDTDWFMDRIVERYDSLRNFSKQMVGRNGRQTMDVSAVSLMLNGKRTMSIGEARQIAKLLNEDLNEVISRAAGIK